MPKINTSMADPSGSVADPCIGVDPDWSPDEARQYWEQRAHRFAGRGQGLPAVCSYGMPRFYNIYLHWIQWLALRPYLQVNADDVVLDVGCGVGRWSLRMANQGAHVTGVDLSAHMVQRAHALSQARGLSHRTQFIQADIAELALAQTFSRILVVTVLQHILDDQRCRQVIARLADHLAPGALLIALEVAPTRRRNHCDTGFFQARSEEQYLSWFNAAGLLCKQVAGVDPLPLKTRYLPHYKRLPRVLAVGGLAMVTALSLPVDLMVGRRCRQASWHKVFVLFKPPMDIKLKSNAEHHYD